MRWGASSSLPLGPSLPISPSGQDTFAECPVRAPPYRLAAGNILPAHGSTQDRGEGSGGRFLMP